MHPEAVTGFFFLPLADLGSGVLHPAYRGPLDRSVRVALAMQCGSTLIHEKLLPRPSRQHAPDIAGLTPRRTSHAPRSCRTVCSVGAGWSRCVQITGQGSKY